MDKPDAWMPHYIGDYNMETIHLTAQQDGIYMRLRAYYWKNGGEIPANLEKLYRAARATTSEEKSDVEDIIRSFFIIDERVIRHAELDKRYKDAWDSYKKKSEAGKKAVKARELRKWLRLNDVSNDEQTTPITTAKTKNTTTTHLQNAAGDESYIDSTTEMMSVQEFRRLYRQTFKSVMNKNLDAEAAEICKGTPRSCIEETFQIAADNGIEDHSHLLSHLKKYHK